MRVSVKEAGNDDQTVVRDAPSSLRQKHSPSRESREIHVEVKDGRCIASQSSVDVLSDRRRATPERTRWRHMTGMGDDGPEVAGNEDAGAYTVAQDEATALSSACQRGHQAGRRQDSSPLDHKPYSDERKR
jgi:chemotaxis response regulator CheB